MRLILFILSLAAFTVNAQSTFFIQDPVSEESIPFVKVYPNDADPFIADLDGAFQLKSSTTAFTLKYGGYRDTLIQVSEIVDSIIYMELNVQQVGEVVVLPGENPAHRIMKKAIANRKANHPMKNDAFRYESYSKFIFDVNQEGLAAIPDSTTDSTLMFIRDFFNEQHLFMLESTSKRTFIPPYRDQEEITAYKVSGFNDPRFSTFANGMQSFSFYDNQFDLFGTPYINPLAKGGINRYLFVLEDSTFQETDTTYTIYYRPRKGKNFNGMEGRLYINTNGYAVEKVIAEPYLDTANFRVKIIQEYTFEDNTKWFPSKLITSIDMGALNNNVENLNMVGNGHTYIKNVDLNPEDLPKRFNSNISIYTADDAGEHGDQDWDSLRQYNITSKEERTYEMIDSLSKVHKFEKRLNIISTLASGKLPLGNYNLDLARLITYNLYEKYRFGLGLETSKKVMKNVAIGGYFGYATGDKEWRYGGYSTIHLNRKAGMKIDLKYQQDVLERGMTNFQRQGFSLANSDALRFLFISSMDRQRLGEVAFTTDINANMTVRLFGNYQRIQYTRDYQYFNPESPFALPPDIDLAETGIEFKWSILEKYMLLGDSKIPNGTKFPTIRFKAVKGWDWFESDFEYYRLYASVSQRFRFLGLGELRVKAEVGKTIGDVPLVLSHQSNGTGINWLTSVENSFETMTPASFYNTEFAAFYTKFAFQPFKTKATWNEPKISLHHALGFGRFDGMENHSISFESMEEGYFEGGLILDGLFTYNSIGFGIGTFYRYGFYSDADWKKNIVPKIAISLVL
jgi:hypothetical protein